MMNVLRALEEDLDQIAFDGAVEKALTLLQKEVPIEENGEVAFKYVKGKFGKKRSILVGFNYNGVKYRDAMMIDSLDDLPQAVVEIIKKKIFEVEGESHLKRLLGKLV